ncbi:MAG: NUDIX domain-containing protein [Lachnospiraceae bacterium]|nr:NUDIX domain-containing protein [Lachnospiraceae bacterium]
MELWDAYSKNEELTGATLVRGEAIPEGLYHLVCEVLVRHTDGSYLCMVRSMEKPNYGGWYEATAGGSALAGENKWQCVERELKEETGITCHEFKEIAVCRDERKQAFFHTFVCMVDVVKDSVQLQKGETEGYRWMSEEEFIRFVNSEEIIPSNRQRYKTYFEQIGYISQGEANDV